MFSAQQVNILHFSERLALNNFIIAKQSLTTALQPF